MAQLRTLRDALAGAARTAHGYRFVSGDRTNHRSYRELLDAALLVASALRRAGLQQGDLVATVIGDGEAFLTTFFGISLAGCIPAPLSPPADAGDGARSVALAARVLRATGARTVVTTENFKALFDGAPALTIEWLVSEGASYADAADGSTSIAIDDIALVQFTSG